MTMAYQNESGAGSGAAGGVNNSSNLNNSSSANAAAGNKEEVIKSQFVTREGTYKLMTLSEFSRPSRVPLNPHQGNNLAGSAPVRVSFVTIPDDDPTYGGCQDRICFNVGRELFVYPYPGVSKVVDLARPIDKRVYKGTFPTCHDFNQVNATVEGCSLLVGFSAGQIQLIDPFKKDGQINKLYNEERLIDKTRVTCLRWIPGSPHQFLVAHASGYMYVYNEDLICGPTAPAYQQFKQGDGFTVFTCKAKSSRNPLYRWSVGEGAINEFAFSPDGRLLAVVSQDGFLRVFNYHSMELIGIMRSYFGGLLCVAWSPDVKYIVTGGEDDLVSVYSVLERRLVCRGQGHRSWVSQVAFDPYTSLINADGSDNMRLDSEEDLRSLNPSSELSTSNRLSSSFRIVGRKGQKESISSSSLGCVSYRFGSVGHDTLLCLWDLTEDVLKMPAGRIRTSTLFVHSPLNLLGAAATTPVVTDADKLMTSSSMKHRSKDENSANKEPPASGKHKRHFGLRGGGDKQNQNKTNASTNTGGSAAPGETTNGGISVSGNLGLDSNLNLNKMLGSNLCPFLHEVPVIEPLVNKKIAHERLTVLVFREDCVVTACQEGFISTWARPGRLVLSHQHSINSPNPGGSPNMLPGGTIV